MAGQETTGSDVTNWVKWREWKFRRSVTLAASIPQKWMNIPGVAEEEEKPNMQMREA